jgi:predicted nucleotidyltransferase
LPPSSAITETSSAPFSSGTVRGEFACFGSAARDSLEMGSDLDLLVTLDPDRSLLDRIAAAQELEDAFGVFVDLVNERALPDSIRDRVLAEAAPL